MSLRMHFYPALFYFILSYTRFLASEIWYLAFMGLWCMYKHIDAHKHHLDVERSEVSKTRVYERDYGIGISSHRLSFQ